MRSNEDLAPNRPKKQENKACPFNAIFFGKEETRKQWQATHHGDQHQHNNLGKQKLECRAAGIAERTAQAPKLLDLQTFVKNQKSLVHSLETLLPIPKP